MASLLVLLLVGILFPQCQAKFAAASSSTTGRSGHHFVLVHGAAEGAWVWYKVTTLLEKSGNTVTSLDLASNGINKDIADNIKTVAQYTEPLTDFLANNVTAEKVILVGHSFGGSSISRAMELFPQKISKAVFVTALMPSNNESFVQAEAQPSFLSLVQAGVFVLHYANSSSTQPTSFSANLTSATVDLIFNESPLEDVYLAYALFNPTPYSIAGETLSLTPSNYGSIKRYYIRTSMDNVLTPNIQESIINNHPPYQVFTLQHSDHFPFFSQHVALVKTLLNIAQQV